MAQATTPHGNRDRTQHGDVLMALENLARDISQHGSDYTLHRLKDPEVRLVWTRTLELIPPQYWNELRQALDELTGPHGSLSGLLSGDSPFTRGVFGRARVETLGRLIAPERLQSLANIIPSHAKTSS